MGLSRWSILDAQVLDRYVTWLTKHKDASLTRAQNMRVFGSLAVLALTRPLGKQMVEDKMEDSSD